jgi:O-antigen/teichoic acid export membrane protein
MRLRGRSLSLGWLPASQALSLLASLAAFAVLSRELGPASYAQFAVFVFIYTMAALATDFSAMGFLLVHGTSRSLRRAAWSSSAVSAAAGGVVLAAALSLLSLLQLPTGPPEALDVVILVSGLVAQSLIQPLRGQLMVSRKYPIIAVTDVGATFAGFGAAIVLASQIHSVTVLCAQLALTSVVRLVLTLTLSAVRSGRGAPAGTGSPADGAIEIAPNPFRYGLKVLPLNVASYASRAIDSGTLPLILPIGAAAAYARSYQLIVTPITQVQLSLGGAIVERMARRASQPGEDRRFDKRVWKALHVVTFVAAITLSVGAPVLEAVFFGPGWVHVALMISTMALLLPSLTLSSFMSWKLQIKAELRHSLVNLSVLLLVPMLAIVLGLLYSTNGALIGLALGALVQGLALATLHRSLLPISLRYAILQIIAEWAVLAALLIVRFP